MAGVAAGSDSPAVSHEEMRDEFTPSRPEAGKSDILDGITSTDWEALPEVCLTIAL